MCLAKMVLKNNIFEFDNEIHKQLQATANGYWNGAILCSFVYGQVWKVINY